ncbi:MAG: hypothetical protein EOO03_12350 [Chitinophagaceae bacterium]|nr:MAG: hypothetical protein EOO03_12350 [Chitinophagaceae bacterium]
MPSPQLFENIFGKNETYAGNAGMLQHLLKEHPYFSLGHFYLLKQTDAKDAAYSTIAAKTALHFHNIYLLQSQLRTEAEAEHLQVTVNNPAAVKAGESTPVEEEPGVPESEEQATEIIQIAAPTPEPEQNNAAQVVADITAEQAEQSEADTTTTAEVSPEEADEPVAETVMKIPGLVEPPVKEEGSLLFTPLYATDYFASQGIKLRDEAAPNDKLGKQLKSFTDWLKTMKKVHDNKLPEPAVAADSSVQQLAEKSNKEEVVLTESMAEVFLQQGKWHKAKDVYEKLSLLNPTKIAYFAAKIDQIQQK